MTIFKQITAIMDDISAIAKNKINTQQGFKFRGIDDVYNMIHPLLAKHRVFTVPEVIDKNSTIETTAKGTKLFYEKLTIKYTFYSEDGTSFSAIVQGVGMDSGDKAANKAMAIAHKYVLLQVFAIPTEENDDPDKTTPEPITYQKPIQPAKQSITNPSIISAAQRTRLFAIVKESGKTEADLKALIGTMGYGSTKEIKSEDYDKICAQFNGERQPGEE